MLVFFVELEDLENAGASVLEQITRLRFADTTGWNRPEGRQRLVEFDQQGALPIDQLRGQRTLVLAKKAIFFEGALVQLVTELLVLLQGFGRSHSEKKALRERRDAGRLSSRTAR